MKSRRKILLLSSIVVMCLLIPSCSSTNKTKVDKETTTNYTSIEPTTESIVTTEMETQETTEA